MHHLLGLTYDLAASLVAQVQMLSSENVEECPRSIYVMHAYVAFVLRYNKTQHSMQSAGKKASYMCIMHMDKHIARFFPPRLGRLLVSARCCKRKRTKCIYKKRQLGGDDDKVLDMGAERR